MRSENSSATFSAPTARCRRDTLQCTTAQLSSFSALQLPMCSAAPDAREKKKTSCARGSRGGASCVMQALTEHSKSADCCIDLP